MSRAAGIRTRWSDVRNRPRHRCGTATPMNETGPQTLWGPAVWYYDVSLSKRAVLSSRLNLSVEINAFNVFNRANFNPPVATLSDARFGRIIASAAGTTPRQMQLGARLSF